MLRKNLLLTVMLFFSCTGLLKSTSEHERVVAAIQKGDVKRLDAILSQILPQKGRAINLADLLLYAIGASTCRIVHCLLQARDCPVTIEDTTLTTYIKDPEMLKLLVNHSDQDTQTLRHFLEIAIAKGWNDVVRFLIEEKKTPLYIRPHEKSTIHFAAEHGTYETMKLILSLKPDLAEASFNGNYLPLHVAAKYGKLKLVQLLVGTYNVAISPVFCRYKRTPLHYAAREGHLDIVRYLVSMGADIDVKDIFGWAPYHHARIAGKWAVEQFLKAEGERRALHTRALKPRYVGSQVGEVAGDERLRACVPHHSGNENAVEASESPDAVSGPSQSPIAAEQPSCPQLPELRLDVLNQKDQAASSDCEDGVASESSDNEGGSIFFFPHCWQQAADETSGLGSGLGSSLGSGLSSAKRQRDESGSDDDLLSTVSSISERVKRRRAQRQASK